MKLARISKPLRSVQVRVTLAAASTDLNRKKIMSAERQQTDSSGADKKSFNIIIACRRRSRFA